MLMLMLMLAARLAAGYRGGAQAEGGAGVTGPLRAAEVCCDLHGNGHGDKVAVLAAREWGVTRCGRVRWRLVSEGAGGADECRV